MRQRAGLSLAQAARRAGTSAATLSRYENGWARFELYTLRKLAAAVGCEVEVRLKPVNRPVELISETALARRLARLFWDHPLRPGDLRKHTRWVLARVIEYGQLEDVRDLMALLGREAFVQQVRRVNWMSPKTRAFWYAILDLNEETPPCTNEPFRRQAGSFWTAWKR